jgi:hypothetical protein
MRSSHPAPLSGMLGSSAPRRRTRSGSRVLGWILGIVGFIFAIMIAIGFGVDQQAQHHIASPTASITTLSTQHA